MLRELVLLILLVTVPTAVAFVSPSSSRCGGHRPCVTWLLHDDSSLTSLQATRRDVLEHGGSQAAFWVAAAGSTSPPATAAAAATTTTSPTSATSTTLNTNLIADLPMIRLKLPRGGFGREYLALDITTITKVPDTIHLQHGTRSGGGRNHRQ